MCILLVQDLAAFFICYFPFSFFWRLMFAVAQTSMLSSNLELLTNSYTGGLDRSIRQIPLSDRRAFSLRAASFLQFG